jgi:hypothetical protein
MFQFLFILGVGVGGISFGTGVVVLAIDVLDWFTTGKWKPILGRALLQSNGISPPSFSWTGLQQIVDCLLEQPIALLLICFGFAVGFAVLFISAIQRRRARRTPQKN